MTEEQMLEIEERIIESNVIDICRNTLSKKSFVDFIKILSELDIEKTAVFIEIYQERFGKLASNLEGELI